MNEYPATIDRPQRSSGQHRRILLFPAPLQGHITPMLLLANALHFKGFSITVLLTKFNSPDPSNFPNFTFHFFDVSLSQFEFQVSVEIINIFNSKCSMPFKNCLSNVLAEAKACREEVCCLISDPLLMFVDGVTRELKLPRITLRTGGASSFLVFTALPKLQHIGYFPVQEAQWDKTVVELPPVKVKDIPTENFHELIAGMCREAHISRGIIYNTFEELEHAMLVRLQQDLQIPIFPIGPLHKLPTNCSTSLLAHDKSSISWLNTQAPKSVLYVSFGSIAAISKDEFMEIAYGLANSKQPFLWVVRESLVTETRDKELLPNELGETLASRGHMVKWAPQQEILAHPSIGGFWTHCGWNSTIESISEGVPMLCFPFFGDQTLNARYISDTWKIGLQIERPLKREEVERAIKRLMVEKEGEEMKDRASALKKKASLSLMEGGSSPNSLEKLVSFILSL